MNPDTDWLSPGAFLNQLHPLGVPVTQTRTAAFQQLVLQAPALVVAQALGYHRRRNMEPLPQRFPPALRLMARQRCREVQNA
ncbi:hypothetical protein [Actinomadura vinacea]